MENDPPFFRKASPYQLRAATALDIRASRSSELHPAAEVGPEIARTIPVVADASSPDIRHSAGKLTVK